MVVRRIHDRRVHGRRLGHAWRRRCSGSGGAISGDHPLARGALFWIPLTLLFLRGLSPLNTNSLVAFMPFFVAYGAVLYRVFCHRYVARWAVPAVA